MMLFLNTKKQTEERATVKDFSPVHVYIENQLESSLVEGKTVVWTAPTVFLCSCQDFKGIAYTKIKNSVIIYSPSGWFQ